MSKIFEIVVTTNKVKYCKVLRKGRKFKAQLTDYTFEADVSLYKMIDSPYTYIAREDCKKINQVNILGGILL